ncbi:hypothetical protein ACLGI4_05285 [Streptomyces sp. HMX112]|uniref:hypothetical protein n=1 Tax=Streptomyces sp. HMX112 TaxID=3390850 RepID=UPI003A810A4F
MSSPIYDQLVKEHGDVLTETRKLADFTHRQADRMLSWDLHHRGWEQEDRPERERRAERRESPEYAERG